MANGTYLPTGLNQIELSLSLVLNFVSIFCHISNSFPSHGRIQNQPKENK